MIIAIDFDGTCVTHEYPKVGRDIGAAPILKKLVGNGHKLILFTMRSSMRGISPVTQKEEDGGLSDAIGWFKKNDIELWAIQTNPEQAAWTESPKCYAQLYIDDAALGAPLIYKGKGRPYMDWEAAESMLKALNFL